MACQIVAGSEQDARLLLAGNAGRCAAKGGILALAHFDENEARAVVQNKVDFTALDVEIAGDQAQTARFQIGQRPTFSIMAAGDGGIFGFCWHGLKMTTEFKTALYVLATPIGNLGDVTRRGAEILATVPWIAAEDTRHSAPLLKQLGARGKLLPAHQHNEQAAAQRIVEKLQAGEAVALISDAGTPGISDPGARVVAAVHAAGLPVVPVPGACAAIAALSASGFLEERFLFCGFLPSKSGQRQQALAELRHEQAALVFYEAPHRILETVGDLANELGERTLLVARELSKLYESIVRLPLTEAQAWLAADSNRQRGEFVLVVSGAPPSADAGEGERVLRVLLADGLGSKQAARLAASLTGGAQKMLYEMAVRLKNSEEI